MRYQFEQCLEKGKIVEIERDPELIAKELGEAQHDLETSARSLEESDYKWAIVQGYYSMFHSFRALLFSSGYREKSHICLKHAMEALFVDKGLLDRVFLEDFDFAMKTREGADYGYVYNEGSAREITASAGKILKVAQKLLKQNK